MGRRLKFWEYAITVLMIITINFLIPRLMLGDPFLLVSGEGEEEVTLLSEEQRAYYLEYYGLDEPLHRQYLVYLQDLIRGDLGFSLHYREQVSTIIIRNLPWTIFLVLSATFLSTVMGVFMAIISAGTGGSSGIKSC